MSPFITQPVVNPVQVLFPWARYDGTRHFTIMEGITFTAFAIETVNFDQDSPCKIGLTVVENGAIVNSFFKLINPGNVDYYGFVSEEFGITSSMVFKSPEFPEVWSLLVQDFENSPYIVSYGDGYDFRVIRNVLYKYNLPFPNFKFFSSKTITRRIYPEFPSFSINWVCESLGINDYLPEAQKKSETCAKILLKAIEKSGCKTIEELLQIVKIDSGKISSDGTYLIQNTKRIHHTQSGKRISAKDILSTIDSSNFDPEHLMYQKNVSITGTLSRLTKNEAKKLVAGIGGIPQDTVTRETNFLVVGVQDIRVVGDDGLSKKQERAIKYKQQGIDIEFMTEEEFMELF